MAKMKVGIIGSGNRSRLYIDAIKRLPDDFELVMMRFRTEEKAEAFRKEYDIPVTTSMEEFVASKPDFIVDVVNRPDVGNVAVPLLKQGFPILAETPPAESYEEIDSLWKLTAELGVKMLVAENYFAEPGWAAKFEAAKRGYIGDVQAVTVSNTHEYHAASAIRILLDAEDVPFSVIGKKMDLDLTITQDKYGNPCRDGHTEKIERYHMIMNFENGKTGIYDFAIANYWSPLRQNFFLAQGTRGEMMNDEVNFVDENNEPKKLFFKNNTDENGNLVSISLGDDIVYENELLKTKGVGKNIGICHMLLNMKNYLETGECPYSFGRAMTDTYITQMYLEAGRKPFTFIQSEKQPWQ